MSGILGIGIDLCGIERMRKLADDPRFLDRYFTEGERAYVRSKGQGAAQTLAGLFAAKEAVCKALGTGIAFSLRDIEVFHTELGQPQIRLTGAALEKAAGGVLHVSITHELDTAAAFVVWSTSN